MTLLLITTLLFSGLCSLSSSVPRQFHVVKEQKNWTEAQQYCRQEFTDLATIDHMTEMEKVKSLIQDPGVGKAWIGIRLKQGSSSKWQWSLADRDFYREKESEFRNWGEGQSGESGEDCVVMTEDGKWHDIPCHEERRFICYNGANSTQPYVLVKEEKNWADAQRYCRDKHTDLASVRNQTENDQIKDQRGEGAGGNKDVWLGLFRVWEWSDGSSSSFHHWRSGEPNYGASVDFCAQMSSSGLWNDVQCTNQANFICYEDKLVLVAENKTWTEALQYCTEHHVDLVSVSSERIQRWVRERAKEASTNHVWLGLHYSCSLDFWFWVSGWTVCYSNWTSIEEERRGCIGGADRVGALKSGGDGGQWVSMEKTRKLNFICTTDESLLDQ